MTYTETVKCSECGYKKQVNVNTADCCLLEDILEEFGWYQNPDGTWICTRCYAVLKEKE